MLNYTSQTQRLMEWADSASTWRRRQMHSYDRDIARPLGLCYLDYLWLYLLICGLTPSLLSYLYLSYESLVVRKVHH